MEWARPGLECWGGRGGWTRERTPVSVHSLAHVDGASFRTKGRPPRPEHQALVHSEVLLASFCELEPPLKTHLHCLFSFCNRTPSLGSL